jgi:hypothetical protein
MSVLSRFARLAGTRQIGLVLGFCCAQDRQVLMQAMEVRHFNWACDDAPIKVVFFESGEALKLGKHAFPLLLTSVRIGQDGARHLQGGVGLLFAEAFNGKQFVEVNHQTGAPDSADGMAMPVNFARASSV